MLPSHVFRPILAVVLCGFTIGCEQPNPNAVSQSQFAKAQPPEETGLNPAPKLPVDRWHIDVTKNELDGRREVTVSNTDLVLRCSPKLEGYVLPPLPQLGHRLDCDPDYRQLVRFRINDGPIHSGWWSVSNNFEALFIPAGTLRQVIRARKLIVEYQPEYVTRQTATFDISGLKEAASSAGCRF